MSLRFDPDSARAVGVSGQPQAGSTPARPARPAKAPARAKGRPVGVKASGLREKAWRTIRLLRRFTLNELLDINATGREKDAASNLLKYLGQLERHGVIERLARRAGDALTSPGHVVWRLARDLGWDAPVWRSVQRQLWNPNAGAAVAPPGANADAQQGRAAP